MQKDIVMTEYENEQLNEIKLWKEEKPTVVSQAIGMVVKPLAWAVNKIIPQKAIQGALIGADILAQAITDENDIKRDGKVSNISELRMKDLQLSDKLANEVHNWAIATLGTEGGVAGAFGIAGMAVDVPMVITFALRTIHKIGLCYGYKVVTQEDKQFVFSVMSIAGANTMHEKNIAIAYLKRLNVILIKQTWKKMAEKAAGGKCCEEAMLITIRSLAKQLGINITKRKALQAIPVIGAGVGAAMNIAFINDISWAARRCFQERWLIDNEKLQQ